MIEQNFGGEKQKNTDYGKDSKIKLIICNGFSIGFRQSFAKESSFYDEHLQSYNIQY